jgi:hypothetical protein
MTDVRSRLDLLEPELPLGGPIDFLRLIWAVDHALQRRSKSMAATIGITGPQRLVIRIIDGFRAFTPNNSLTFCTCTQARSRPF